MRRGDSLSECSDFNEVLECFQTLARAQKEQIDQLKRENSRLKNELITTKALCESMLNKWELATVQ